MLGRHLFLPLCRSDRLFFFATYQSQKFRQHAGWAKLFFSAESSARLFFQKVFQPPPPSRNETVAP